MKKYLPLFCLALFLLPLGCRTPTTTVLIGAGAQIIACELARHKPAAKAPLAAAGKLFTAFAQTTPPDPGVVAAALAAIPKLELEQAHVDVAWNVITVAYTEAYRMADTPEKMVRLQLLLNTLGSSLSNGSTCGSPSDSRAGAARQIRFSKPVTWADLSASIKSEFATLP